MIALGLAAVDAMVNDRPEEIAEDDPRLQAVKGAVLDRPRALLVWAKATGRM